jgi:hypothetical protein
MSEERTGSQFLHTAIMQRRALRGKRERAAGLAARSPIATEDCGDDGGSGAGMRAQFVS